MLPKGATLLGTILSSDKTNISVMTGDRTAHPVLLSLANIHADVRMKSSNHAFLLIALLPCPKFIVKDKGFRGVLENRVVHLCLDIVTNPLKLTACAGRMMADPRGYSRFCFTALASYMVDTPEAAMLAGVAGKTSHLTMADYRKFGDPVRQEPRTASTTLAQLAALATNANPLDLPVYIPAAKAIRLNGVHLPFWRDWILQTTPGVPTRVLMADPCRFLTPEPLHHWHKQFWDHDMKWAIRVVGADEIDFRFSTLQPIVGFKHFKDGVSTLKQVTGRTHRDVQRYIVGIIAGRAPPSFVIAIRALMEFRYLAQSRELDDNALSQLSALLQLFHQHKQTILTIGARVGKGNKPMDHFQIPKLELMHGVVPSVIESGAVIQWSADTTEHAHITEIKVPGRSGNNQDYNPQICRWLDRSEKHRNFSLALHLLMSDTDPVDSLDDEDDTNNNDPLDDLPPTTSPLNFFTQAVQLSMNISPSTPLPLRTFCIENTAFHLNRHPNLVESTIEEVAVKFGLPDLRPALADYIQRTRNLQSATFKIGQRRSAHSKPELPFDRLRVWYSVRIQVRLTDSADVSDVRRVCAEPPSPDWPFGRYDTVLLSDGSAPGQGLHGMTSAWCLKRRSCANLSKGFDLAQIRLIFHPIWSTNVYLTYAERFDIIPQLTYHGSAVRERCPDPVTGMYVVRRSSRSNGTRMGDIIPLSQVRIAALLIPRYGSQADPKLTRYNSLEFSTEFSLNKFFDKELYYFMLQNDL